MKPIKLILSGFGSYGGREEIDFEKMDKGIFLITGDTGAGKTTIFDAITYALFDETSGGKREGDMMRSQYAKDDVATYVEYTFSYGGERYCVKRNPNYQRISKRKNKDGEYSYTNEPASVELILPDGRAFQGKIKEVNEKIKEILGVDVKQFTQISMIAQGEFLKLLHASSKERKEIFSKIFDTGVYRGIQRRFKEQSKDLQEKLSENETLLHHNFSGIWCPNLEFSQRWDLLKEKLETGQEEILQILEEIQMFLEENQKQLEEQSQKQAQELEQVKIHMVQAEEINGKFAKRRETEAKIQDIKKKLADVQERICQRKQQQKEVEEKVQQQIPKLDQELAEARNLLPRYRQQEERKKETLELEKRYKQVEQALSDLIKKHQECGEKTQKFQESQKLLLPKIQEIPETDRALQESLWKRESLQKLSDSQKQLEKQTKEKEKATFKMMKALEEFEGVSREYERVNHIFIEEQAGILAQKLVEGEPCPVCGSTQHPKKKELSNGAVTQQQVEDAKVAREKSQKMLELSRQEHQNVQQECHSLFQVLQHQAKGLEQQAKSEQIEELIKSILEAQEEQIPWEIWKEKLQVSLEECEQEFSKISEKKKLLEQQQQLYQRQEQELSSLQEQEKKCEIQRQELQEKSYQEKLAYEKAYQSFLELEESLTFPSAQALENHMQELIQRKQNIEEQQKEIVQRLQLLQQQIAKGEGQLEEQKKVLKDLNDSLKEKSPVDLSVFQEKAQKLQEQQKELERKKINWISGKERNQEFYKNIKTFYEQREKLKREFQVADTLSKTANGNLRQQARLDLETYVQRKYFKGMIGAANTHLAKISGGRFILQCRNMEQLGKQGEAGLDLDVYDLITDQYRDIKTLSGGESFLAALSMAMGMADVIQRNAAKVRFDTMFIDEGFGSLDEDARTKSLQILQELAGENRLIGIISHVTEMKEQMDKKLVISKGNHGSSATWQMES